MVFPTFGCTCGVGGVEGGMVASKAVEAHGTVEASNGLERGGGQVQRVSAFVISRLGGKKR